MTDQDDNKVIELPDTELASITGGSKSSAEILTPERLSEIHQILKEELEDLDEKSQDLEEES